MMSAALAVMVVDDDEDIREGVRDLLEDHGYAVVVASNGLEALGRLRAGARPGVILLDLMMPVMDGYEFVIEQRKEPAFAGIPIVVITADGNARDKAVSVGARGHVQKPFKAQKLLQSVEQFRQ